MIKKLPFLFLLQTYDDKFKLNARKAYEQYKSAADGGVPGAQTSYDKLKVRFEKNANATVVVNP